MNLFFSCHVSTTQVSLGLLIVEASKSHHTREDCFGRVIGPSQRPLPDNTQHSQDTDIHGPGGIRTRSPSKREAADPRIRQRGHWGRQIKSSNINGINSMTSRLNRSTPSLVASRAVRRRCIACCSHAKGNRVAKAVGGLKYRWKQ